jgi:hypothetical protein
MAKLQTCRVAVILAPHVIACAHRPTVRSESRCARMKGDVPEPWWVKTVIKRLHTLPVLQFNRCLTNNTVKQHHTSTATSIPKTKSKYRSLSSKDTCQNVIPYSFLICSNNTQLLKASYLRFYLHENATPMIFNAKALETTYVHPLTQIKGNIFKHVCQFTKPITYWSQSSTLSTELWYWHDMFQLIPVPWN